MLQVGSALNAVQVLDTRLLFGYIAKYKNIATRRKLMTIQILGPGCPNCHNLEKNAREAVQRLGIEADFQKVTDSDQIVEMGVMRTPGLAIDGKVQKFGKVLSTDEIAEVLQSQQG